MEFGNRINRIKTLVGLMSLVAVAPSANAVALGPCGWAGLPGTTAAAQPVLNGVILKDTITPFVIKNSAGAILVRGRLQDRVVRSNITGRMHFYFRVFNDGGGAITSVQRISYTGFFTDVNWRLDGLGNVQPTSASRSCAGNMVTYNFGGAAPFVWPGMSSRYGFAATNAWQFNPGGLTRIVANGGAGGVVLPSAQPM